MLPSPPRASRALWGRARRPRAAAAVASASRAAACASPAASECVAPARRRPGAAADRSAAARLRTERAAPPRVGGPRRATGRHPADWRNQPSSAASRTAVRRPSFPRSPRAASRSSWARAPVSGRVASSRVARPRGRSASSRARRRSRRAASPESQRECDVRDGEHDTGHRERDDQMPLGAVGTLASLTNELLKAVADVVDHRVICHGQTWGMQ